MKRLMNLRFGFIGGLLVVVFCGVCNIFHTPLYGQSWHLVSWVDLQTGTEVIIADTASGLAMSNDKGTSSAPGGIALSFREGKRLLDTTGIDARMLWRVEKDSQGCVFYKADDTTRWLYCTNTNNGVRVGTNTNRIFSLYDGNWLFNLATSRYVGVYSGSDWRAYTTQPTTGLVKTTRTAFYQFVPPCAILKSSSKTGCDTVKYVDAKQREWIALSDTVVWDTIRTETCDTIVQVNIVVYKSSPMTETSVSAVDSFVWHHHIYTESGDYAKTFSNRCGCDSMEILHLEIVHVLEDTSSIDTLIIEAKDSLGMDSLLVDTFRIDTLPEVHIGEDSVWVDTLGQKPDTLGVLPLCGEENGVRLEVEDFEGHRYGTVRLGRHCWMAENLRATIYSSNTCGLRGVEIPRVGRYYSSVYPDSLLNMGNFGCLYDWNAAAGVCEGSMVPCVNVSGYLQGVCPDGWHLPNEEEVIELLAYTLPDLISLTGWLCVNGNGNTAFALCPAGFFDVATQRYVALLGETLLWTANSFSETAEIVRFRYSCPYGELQRWNKNNKCSVRCLKDEYESSR